MSEIKLFKDRHVPIKIDLETKDSGEVFHIESKFLSGNELAEVELIGYTIVNPKSKIEWERTETGKLAKMMTRFFGKEIEFWMQFSAKLLGEILNYVQTESKKN